MTGGRHATIELTSGPESVGAARRSLTAALREWAIDDDLIERVVLVASELVTNAVLHAGGALEVRAEAGEPGVVRIEVVDGGPALPALRRYGTDAATGRGLALVSAVAASWGVEVADEGGKAVWAVLAGEGAATPPSATDQAAGSLATAGQDWRELVLRDVPVATYLAMEAHHAALLRELDLLAIRLEEADPHQAALPARLRELIQASRRRFNRPRTTFDRDLTAAQASGRTVVDLQERFPATAALALHRYVNLLEEAEGYARDGLLLAVAPSAAVVGLRRWLVAESTAQLEEGRAPRPMPS